MNVIVKSPGTAWPVHEMTDLVGFPLPEAANPAEIAMLLPFDGIEAAFMVEGSGEFIAAAAAAIGEILGPAELEPHTLKRHDVLLDRCLMMPPRR
jgi:hypothetical protein